MRIRARARRPRAGSAFFFAAGCPISYLAAERVEWGFGEVEWVPALDPLQAASAGEREQLAQERFTAAERWAWELRLPLVRPERLVASTTALTRSIVLAGERGAGSRFALAAARLIFCGGFEIDDPQVVAEAAEAAGLPSREILEEMTDDRLELAPEATTRDVLGEGVFSLPAVRTGTQWLQGIAAIAGAPSPAVLLPSG